MKVFAISGWSQTGKTTLAKKIIKSLIEKGFEVASLKSTHKNLEDDIESDTYHHQIAGANPTILRGKDHSILRYKGKISLKTISELDVDFLIVEGLKQSKIPKIWCSKSDDDSWIEFPEVRAIVIRRATRTETQKRIPILTPNDTEQLVSIIIQNAEDIQNF
ncbi:MAG: molybdopterin-guanine dinucleotide biosynthesis protein B [Candidatus Lokiarchaeota archaeon]|nr:molybdopterin-guanine dinucleotide biosynthesis protein B [Candidatus Lokiarchaeota archaeon]